MVVRLSDDGYVLDHPDLGPVRLKMSADTDVTGFVAGWTPAAVHTAFHPFTLLEFAGPGGEHAFWIIDRDGVRLGDSVPALAEPSRQAFLQAVRPVLTRILTRLVLTARPQLSPEDAGVMQIDPGFLHPIIDQVLDLLPSPSSTLADALGETHELAPGGTAIRGEHLTAGFRQPLLERLIETTSGQEFSWPSPVDGRALPCRGSIVFDDFRFAYRFVDDLNDLVFYVIGSDHVFRSIAVYFPAANLLVSPDEWCRHLVQVYFRGGVNAWLTGHALKWARPLATYLAAPPVAVISVLRGIVGLHIGHQMWNELTGIDAVLTGRRGARLPLWLVQDAQQSTELWGKLEALFPEITDRVIRGTSGADEMIALVYANRLCAARITSEKVSSELRRRVSAMTERSQVYADVVARLRATDLDRSTGLVVVMGLRVENRTLVDFPEFCTRVALHVAQNYPGSVLIIDGHNTRGETQFVIGSHGESAAARTPLDVERDIADQVRAAVDGHPLTVIDTLGKPLSESLAWIFQADCFITPWGANLAKLRWACNRPGLVLSSRANLDSRDDLHIYDAPRYIENATPMTYIDAAFVTDRPDVPRLVPIEAGNPYFANFSVDMDAVLDAFDRVAEAARPGASPRVGDLHEQGVGTMV